MIDKCRLGRIDGRGSHREASKLGRNPFKSENNGIGRWRGGEKLIRLNVEGSQNGGEQAPLSRTPEYSEITANIYYGETLT